MATIDVSRPAAHHTGPPLGTGKISALVFIVWCAHCAVGCHLLSGTAALWSQRVSASPDLSADLLRDLAAAIDGDGWRLDSDWSPIMERNSLLRGHRVAEPHQRWTYKIARIEVDAAGNESTKRVPQVEEIINSYLPVVTSYPKPSFDTAAQAPFSQHKSGSQDESGSQHKSGAAARADDPSGEDQTVDEVFVRYLSALAPRDDLVGWNATILLAQRVPQAAQRFEGVLANLVADPPTFVPNRGRQPKSDKTSTAETNQAGNTSTTTQRKISRNMRAAAAEAWCLVLATAATDAETAMAGPGRLLLEAQQTDQTKRTFLKAELPDSVKGELMRGIARRVAPSSIPGLGAYMRSSQTNQFAAGTTTTDAEHRLRELRRAAIDGCVLHAVYQRSGTSDHRTQAGHGQPVRLSDESTWPQTLWMCRYDSDPLVRRSFGQLVAVAKNNGALSILKSQLLNNDSGVRQEALRNLGLLDSDEARQALLEYMQRVEPLIRITAVQGLAAWGEQALLPFAGDSDSRVRQEIARQLGQFHSQQSAHALVALITDSAPAVQETAVSVLSGWPDKLAIPLLLHGVTDGLMRTRKLSIAQLNQRSHGNVSFHERDTREALLDEAMRFARSWNVPFPFIKGILPHDDSSHQQRNSERIAEIEAKLAKLSAGSGSAVTWGLETEWFRKLTPEDLSSVESVAGNASPEHLQFLFSEVLPRLSPEYEALKQLADPDVRKRRRGAKSLKEIGERKTLRAIVLSKLEAMMVAEQDPMVWRQIMSAIMPDATEQSARIALLAANHNWADVRLEGCRFIERHGHYVHEDWLQTLRTLFQDDNPRVQLAAARAAGHCGNRLILDEVPSAGGMPALPGLRTLLLDSRGELHLTVVESMSRLLDPQAMEELARLSFEGDLQHRLRVVRAMAATGQTRFVDRLINIAWQEDSRPEIKRAAIQAVESMFTPDLHPDGLSNAKFFNDRVTLWHRWWQQRKRFGQSQQPTTVQSTAHAAEATGRMKPASTAIPDHSTLTTESPL